jgi:hypothetical protein
MPEISNSFSNHSNKNREQLFVAIICLLFGIIFFSYVFARALTLSITHDEAFSWNHVVQHPFMEIVSYNTSPGPGSPNNHILNSLLMKLCAELFGPSAFVLRLPSLLAYLFYLVFSSLICKRLKNPILIIAGFLLLNIDPYLLEFFGLARGYALANAGLLGAIYFLLEWKTKNEKRLLAFAFLFAALSVLANFSLVQFYIGFFVVVNLILISQQQQTKNRFADLFRKNRIPLIFTISLAIIIYEPLRKIIKWHETFGGTIGFWNDTAKSEISAYCAGQTYTDRLTGFLEITIILFTILIFAAIIKSVLKKEWSSNALLVGLLFFIPVLIHLTEHALSGNEFLTGRTAQYFIPLFILAFIFSAEYMLGKFSFYLTGLLALSGIFHLSNAANISHTTDWLYDSDNKKALDFINSTLQKNSSHRTQIGITWLSEPGLNFYRETENMNWLDTITRENVAKRGFEIYYVFRL